MARLSFYTSQTPTTADSNSPAGQRVLASVFASSIPTYAIGARWYAPSTLPTSAPSMSLWLPTGGLPGATTATRLTIKSFVLASMTPSTWNEVLFTTPIALTASVPYAVQLWTPDHYCFAGPDPWPLINGTLSAYSSASSGNSRFTNGAADTSYAQANPGSNGYVFFADVITDPAAGVHKGARFLTFF